MEERILFQPPYFSGELLIFGSKVPCWSQVLFLEPNLGVKIRQNLGVKMAMLFFFEIHIGDI